MKQLEISPLLENVTLMSSMRANDNGKEVTQFSSTCSTRAPPPPTCDAFPSRSR
jgi:hypothetical protein